MEPAHGREPGGVDGQNGTAGRTMVSPFTFYCGAAKIMAADLAGVGPGFFGGEPSTCYPFWVIP